MEIEAEAAKIVHTKESCNEAVSAVKDTLYVLNGKWKLPLIMALSQGPKRFNDIQRSLDDITPKILSKELRDLELNEFIERKVYSTTPVTVIYELTEYSDTLQPILANLKEWGIQHRERIKNTMRKESDKKART